MPMITASTAGARWRYRGSPAYTAGTRRAAGPGGRADTPARRATGPDYR